VKICAQVEAIILFDDFFERFIDSAFATGPERETDKQD
jgi:hypothetical protein